MDRIGGNRVGTRCDHGDDCRRREGAGTLEAFLACVPWHFGAPP